MRLPKYLDSYVPENVKISPVSEYIYRVESDLSQDVPVRELGRQRFLIISGMSGGGKTSVCNEIIKLDQSFEKVKTSTTRPRRSDEDPNNDPYFRYTVDEFKKCLECGEVMEYTEYADDYHFTLRDSISSVLKRDKNPVAVLDPKGSNFYRQKWTDGDESIATLKLTRIFVIPPSIESMRERLILRSGDMELVERRMTQSLEDVVHVHETDYVVVNESGKLEEVVRQIIEVI